MEFLIVNQTKTMVGAHATTMLVNDYVAGRLGRYGPGVRAVEVTLLYPPKAGLGPVEGPFARSFASQVRRAPRVTFYRPKKRIDVLYVCRGVGPKAIGGGGHLTLAEAERLVAAAIDGLELIPPKVTPADRFDAAAFVADARDALARCPRAVRRWLAS